MARTLQTAVTVLILLLGLNGGLAAQTENFPPVPQQYITDQAGVLDATTLATVNQQLDQFDKATTNQIVVAIYASLPANTPIDPYCTDTFNAWGVGQKGKNNGAVLFVFIKNHQMVIRTGRGFEKVLPDATCKQIIVQVIAPPFKQGNYAEGVRAGVNSIITTIKNAGANSENH